MTRLRTMISFRAIARSLRTQISNGSPSPAFCRRREAAHALITVGAWDKPVQRRVLCGGALRSIDAKIPGYFINLILHEVERRDLDVRVENLRRIRTSLQTMPG